MSDNTIDPSLPSDDISEDEVNDAAVPYRIGLLEDLADPEEVMAYVEAALEDGNQEVIKLALRHVIQAREISNSAANLAGMDASRYDWAQILSSES